MITCRAHLACIQLEIESHYDSPFLFGPLNQDIRKNLFSPENPMCEKTVKGVKYGISNGLIRNRAKTYLVHANSKLIGECLTFNEAKSLVP